MYERLAFLQGEFMTKLSRKGPANDVVWIGIVLGCAFLVAGTAAAQEQKPAPTLSTPVTHRQRAWRVLRDGLGQNSADRRAKAVNALGLLPGNLDAEKAAREALKDEKYNVRVAAATALGSMHAVRSIPQLEAALDDEEPTVVLASASSLLLLKDTSSAYDIYYGVLTGTMRPNRGLIHEQLRTLHDTKKMAEIGFQEGIGFVPFAGFGYGIAKTIIKSESDSSLIRAAAAKRLALDPDPASGEALVAASLDENWLVRAAALEAIAQRGDTALVSRITPSLSDTKDEVRYTAASCVIHLTDRSRKPAAKTENNVSVPKAIKSKLGEN
jgi:hypothetical protein